MPLAPASRLGPYEIIGLLGVGGMGEVYRARDPRIGREVAIKTLPARFSQDPEALRRFEQEARAAGVLNHPNVLAVYDVGSDNGTHYVVSELLEGESLKERLDRGAIPRRKAIDYALEVLKGLAAAHEKGIVHRDLKPANLFLTRDDRIKILDFGLANLHEPAPAESDATQRMGPATSPGVIMGSVGYMSPEQIRGTTVDHRSDIFSIGLVIYEMLSGKQAFAGDSAVECMNAILKEDPPPLEAVPAIDGVLRHCVEKQPDLRFQSARDLAFALEAAASAPSTTAIVSPVPIAKPARAIPWKPLAVVAGLVAVAAAGYLMGNRGPRAVVPEYHRLGLYHGESLFGIVRHRFSPDGQTIFVGGHHGVTLTRVDNPAVRSLDLPGYELLSVSTNSDLALIKDGVLSTVPFSGGAPRTVAEHVLDADWTSDGKALVLLRRINSKSVIEYPAGHAIYETTNSLGALRVSPKDDSLAVFEYDADRRSIVIVKRNGEHRVLSPGWMFASRLAWTPDGKEIWFSAARTGYDYPIWAVDLSGHERLVQRVPGRLFLDDIAKDGRALVELSFSRAGTAFRGPADETERDLSWLDFTTIVALSDDGSQILFNENGEAAGPHRLMYLRDTHGGEAVRLGEGEAVWLSRDKQTVLALSEEQGKFVVLPTGAGQARTVAGPGKLHEAGLILPDGRILCWAQEPGHGSRVYVQDGAGWKAISPEFADPRAGFQTILSPTGDRVAALHGQDLLLISTATLESHAIEGWPFAHIAGWTTDGKALWQGRANPNDFEIARFDLATGRSEVVKRVEVKGMMPAWIRVTPDGKSYAYTYQTTSADAFVVSGLR